VLTNGPAPNPIVWSAGPGQYPPRSIHDDSIAGADTVPRWANIFKPGVRDHNNFLDLFGHDITLVGNPVLSRRTIEGVGRTSFCHRTRVASNFRGSPEVTIHWREELRRPVTTASAFCQVSHMRLQRVT